MKKILTIAVIALSGQLFAQQPINHMVDINKESAPAWIIRFDADKKIVEKAIEAEMAESGLKKFSKDSGFQAAKGIVWNAVSPEQRDVYYKVVGNKKKSEVQVLVSTGYNNFVSTQNHGEEYQAVGNFLNRLPERVNELKVLEDMAGIQKEIEKLKKKQAKNEKSNKKLQNSIKKAEKSIESNDKDTDKLQAEIDKLEKQLEAAK